MLDHLRDELIKITDDGRYLAALSLALTIPDIAGALDSQNGWAKPEKYVAWFDRWAEPKFHGRDETTFTGEAAYEFRCRLLHQGRAVMRPGGAHKHYSRLLFLPPGAFAVHMSNFQGHYILHVPDTVRSILDAFADWEAAHGNDPHVLANAADTVELHPDGWPGLFMGMPVIG